MAQNSFQIGEIWSAVKRRLWLLVLSVIVITPAGLMVAIGLPSVYSSTAKILVEAQQIPDSLVQSTVQVDAAERMALLRQRLLTRQNLLDMADRLNLFDDQPGLSATAVQNTLRRAIEIKDIKLRDRGIYSRGPILATAFTISYRSPSAVEAARIANELVSMALELNVETRSERATETRRFLERKAQDLATELAVLETEIAQFKIDNSDALPESLAARRSEMGSLRERRFAFESEILNLGERRLVLEESLERGRPTVGQTQAPQSVLTPEEVDLQRLERELAQAKGVFAETHPNIRALVSRIDSLKTVIAENRIEAEAAAIAAANGENVPAADPRLEAAAEEALANVRRELDSIGRRVGALQDEIKNIKTRQEALQSSINRTPEVEIALIALERRHAVLSTQYQDAVRKEAAAADGEELEISRQAERYRVLEQAQIPESPDWPPRKLIALGGAGGSVALGLLLMIGAELRNMSVRTAGQVERRVNIRPLATIPLVRSSHDKKRRIWRVLLLGIVLSATISGALLAVDRFYLPLDLLIERIMDQTGLGDLIFGGDDDG